MNAVSALQGLRVVVTRPAAQAEPLCRLLEQRGAAVRRLPLQVIEPVRNAAQAARQLAEHRDAQAWIFTSVNAVKFASTLDPGGVWPDCIAVGAATAAALQARGEHVALPLSAHTSEGLLELEVLRDVADRKLLIVSGEGGRELLRETLQARGACVTKLPVYRRVSLPHPSEAVAVALRGAQAAIITSGESLQRLHDLIAPEPAAHRALQLVVPSQRVVEQAEALGFERPALLPESIADAAYVQCLEHWWAEVAPRDPA
ncbi:MAG TPA: uroporphyrinogen-III synthase [Solimonas sp.]